MEKFDAPYSDQVRNRREKLAQLQAEGMDPYAQTKFIFDSNSAQIKENFDQMEGKPVSLAGLFSGARAACFGGDCIYAIDLTGGFVI